MGLLETLNAMIPAEDIDGANPRETAAVVDLSVEFTPVVDRAAGQFQHIIPEPVRVQKDGERYCLMFGTDYRWVGADELKVMRARYLLLRGWYYRHLRGYSHPEQQKLISWYFKGGVWVPEAGSEIGKAMGVI